MTGELLRTLQPPPYSNLSCTAFSPDGRYLAVGAFGGEVWLLETTNYTTVWQQPFQAPAQVRVVTFSPDSATIYVSSDTSPIYALNRSDGSVRWRSYTTSFAYQDNIVPSADGRRIAVESKHGGFVVLDQNGQDVFREESRDGGGHAVLVAPDASFYVSTPGVQNGVHMHDPAGRLYWWSNYSSEGEMLTADGKFVLLGAALYDLSGTLLWTDDTAESGTPHLAVITSDKKHILVAGENGTIYFFEGQVCTPAISSSSATPAAAGGAGSVSVTAGSGCAWTTTSNSSFITVTAGASGSGDGTVSYSVAANPTASARTGTVTIAGWTFTVTQDAAVALAPVITTQPATQAVTAGTAASFSAAASGAPTPTVQWQVSANSGVTWTNVSGATSTSYSVTPSTADDGTQYRAVFTNLAGTATSTAATLTVTGGSTLPTFLNDPLQGGVTPVTALHIIQLRHRIDELRTRAGLSAMTWTDDPLVAGATVVKAVHLVELRTALTAVYVKAGRDVPTFTDASLVAGTTTITATHITELRAAVLAIW